LRRYAVSVKECAKRLGRDTVTIYIALSAGRIKGYKVKNKWFIPVNEIKKFLGRTQIRKKGGE
jgi:excisionase family DNA binding protein